MKKIVLSLVCLGFFSSLVAQDMGTAIVNGAVSIAKEKIKADKEVAIKKKAKVTVSEGSKVEADSKMNNNNLVVGAVGTVVAVGEEVEISGGSKVKASSKMGNNNKVIGTAGAVVLGSH